MTKEILPKDFKLFFNGGECGAVFEYSVPLGYIRTYDVNEKRRRILNFDKTDVLSTTMFGEVKVYPENAPKEYRW